MEGGPGIQSGLALFDREWANIRAGQAWAGSRTSQENVLDKESETAFWLLSDYPNAGVYVLDLHLHPLDEIRWREMALDASGQLKDRDGEGANLGNLGLAYAAQGEYRKAIEFYEQQLSITREIGDRRGEGNALWNMSLALNRIGKRAQAIDNAKSALNIYEQIESPHAEKVRRKLAEWQG